MVQSLDFQYDPIQFDEYHQIEAYRLIYPDENIIRFLTANFSLGKRSRSKILDLGCGTGRHMLLLKELGFQAYGIDGSTFAVNYTKHWLARNKFKADVRQGLITDLPYNNNFFNCVIEHATLVNNTWKDILATCNECYRVMKNEGIGFFLLKRLNDCAFNGAKRIGSNTYVVRDRTFISQKKKRNNFEL